MRIKMTFRYTEYPDSKLATLISKFKGNFTGFVAWFGLWLLPLILAGGIGGIYGKALLSILITAACMLISYGLLFLIDESEIAERKAQKTRKANSLPAWRNSFCLCFLKITKELAQDIDKEDIFSEKCLTIYQCITNLVDEKISLYGSSFFFRCFIRDGRTKKANGIPPIRYRLLLSQ